MQKVKQTFASDRLLDVLIASYGRGFVEKELRYEIWTLGAAEFTKSIDHVLLHNVPSHQIYFSNSAFPKVSLMQKIQKKSLSVVF